MSGNIIDMLIAHEGLRLKPYRCPAGKLTIGAGRNIEDLGITREEAIMLLHNDITRVSNELKQFTWYGQLSQARQEAMIDMCFNLGITRFKTFKRMIAALEDHNYYKASTEMIASKWADQVGPRAVDLADIIRTGA
jgi:lysozyme